MPKRSASSVSISVDIEDLGGIAPYGHVTMQGVEHGLARRWMADEANARSEGARMALLRCWR